MESDAYRVAVHAGDDRVDVELPSGLPVALLLAPLCDIVDDAVNAVDGARDWPRHLPRQLVRPGRGPVDTSKSLHDNGIRDGDILLLQNPKPPPSDSPPALGCADLIIASTTSARHAWTVSQSRLAGLAVTVVLAGAAGFATVPGPAAVPHLLLTASASGAAAFIAARVARYGRTAFTAQAFGTALVIAAALGAGSTGGDLRCAGVLLSTAAITVLASAGRLALLLGGMSIGATRDLDPAAAAPVDPSTPVGEVLTALILASAATAALGVLLTLSQRPTAASCALAATVSITLFSRARTHSVMPQRIALVAAATAAAAAMLAAVSQLNSVLGPWLCAAAATLPAVAVRLGERAAQGGLSPVARNGAEMAERAVLAAVIPLACLSLDIYGAAWTWVAR